MNMDEWIDFIEDEDEQAQILLWAKMVKKGKMTPEEFSQKVQ